MIGSKNESFLDWVKNWDESQWNSREWRYYLISMLAEAENFEEKLIEAERLSKCQVDYITFLERKAESLERQVELLHKTLDLAEKFAPHHLIIPQREEVIK